MKKILDSCCGSRMFWFNKEHPNATYIDNREVDEELVDGRRLVIKPDELMDFKDLKYPDSSFKLVVFDPPHLKVAGEKGWQAKKYGSLDPLNWQYDIAKGFRECWRVLEDDGVLIFKWNEEQITHKEVLEVLGQEPLFGHPTGRSGKTKWFCFMKLNTPKT